MATALDLLMSTKEDVNLLSEESDICTIDAKTRVIFVPSTIVVGGVQSDKNAERIKFSCPKIVGDNLDLSKFSVRINFENVSSVDFNVSIKDQYICDDVAVDGENVTFSWLIGRNAARYMGTVRFIVCAVKTDSDSNISVEWNTTIAEVPVLEGIEIDQPQIGQEEKDVINQLLELTKNTSAEAIQNVNSAKEQAIKDIQSVSQPDTTLTIEGGLAEAKATGEAIGSLKEDLSNKYKNLVLSSNFEDEVNLQDWVYEKDSLSIVDGVLVISMTKPYQTTGQRIQTKASHKYYCKTLAKTDGITKNVQLMFAGKSVNITSVDAFENFSFIVTSDGGNYSFQIKNNTSTLTPIAYIKNFLCADLTDMYGYGNEPSKVDFDKIVKNFNQWYFGNPANINELTNFFENKIEFVERKTYNPVVEIADRSTNSSSPMKMLNLKSFYNMWDLLISSHPNFKKEILGKDESQTYDIWKISWKPASPKYKFILTANLHGYNSDSRTAGLCLYYFLYDIRNNYKADSVLNWIFYNVEFVFIPVANPYGWETGNRYNSNNVNINRNFSYNYPSGSSHTAEYGSAPFSEVETQYIKNLIDENTDAIGFIDLHCYGDNSETNLVEYYGDFGKNSVAQKVCDDVGNFFIKQKYNDATYWARTFSPETSNGGTSVTYAECEKGIDSCTLEFSTKPKNMTQFSEEHIRRQLEWYGEVLYMWANEYPMLHNYLLSDNGKRYIAKASKDGTIKLELIN